MNEEKTQHVLSNNDGIIGAILQNVQGKTGLDRS